MPGFGLKKVRPALPAIATSGKESVVGGPEFSHTKDIPTKILYQGLTYTEMRLMYVGNVWVRVCVDRTTGRIVGIEPVIRVVGGAQGKVSDEAKRHKEEIEDFIANPNATTESFDAIRQRVTKDSLIYGAGAMEIVKAATADGTKKTPVELYSVPSQTIKLNVDERGIFRDLNEGYHQVDEGGKVVARFPQDELIYLNAYPESGRIYPLSPLESLRQTVTAELYAAQYNLDFFANNATPKFAVMFSGLPSGTVSEAMTRLRQWWDHELRGHPHRPLLLGTAGGQVQFAKVAHTQNEMQFQEYSRILMLKIAGLYGVPPFIIGVVEATTGKLNSQQQEEGFKKDAMTPHLRLFKHHFNQEVIWPELGFGYRDVYLDWKAFLQKDEKELAEINEIYWRIGALTINMIREQLGLDRIDAEWADMPFISTDYIPIDLATSLAAGGQVPAAAKMLSHDAIRTLPGLAGLEEGEVERSIVSYLSQRDSMLNKLFIQPGGLG